MSRQIDCVAETQSFLEELEKAKALSMETLELDRLRREQRTRQGFHQVVLSHRTATCTASNISTANYEAISNLRSRESLKAPPKMSNTDWQQQSDFKHAISVADLNLPPPPPRRSPAPQILNSKLEDLIIFSPKDQKEKRTPLEELESSLEVGVAQSVSSTTSFSKLFIPNGLVLPECNGKNNHVASSTASSSSLSSAWNSPSSLVIPPLAFEGPSIFNCSSDQTTVPLFSPPTSPRGIISSASFSNTPLFNLLRMPRNPSNPNLNSISTSSVLSSPSTSAPLSHPICDSSSLSVLKILEKKRNSNLIDLAGEAELFSNMTLSAKQPCSSGGAKSEDILQAFDPLSKPSSPPDIGKSCHASNGGPFLGNGTGASVSEPLHSSRNKDIPAFEDNFDPTKLTLVASQSDKNGALNEVLGSSPPPPPLPPRTHTSDPSSIVDGVAVPLRNKHRSSKPSSFRRTQSHSYESIRICKGKLEPSSELESFCRMVVKLRSEFLFNDYHTNVGLVISPTLESLREESTSVKLVITSTVSDRPILFTCDVTTSVEHIISHVVCTLFDDISDIDFTKFVLKVQGLAEYFSADSSLVDYEYVHHCQKYDEDVQLTLVRVEDLKRPLARTAQDDNNDMEIKIQDLLPPESQNPIPYQTIAILLETFEREVEKMREQSLKSNAENLQSLGVVQAVKAICAILSQVEIAEVTNAVEGLIHVSQQFGKNRIHKEMIEEFKFSEEEVLPDTESMTIVELANQLPNTPDIRMELLQASLERLNRAIRDSLDMYCRSFYVDFHVPSDLHCSKKSIKTKEISSVLDTLLIHVSMIHRIPKWSSNYDSFQALCSIYHGNNLIHDSVETKPARISSSFHDQILFNEWVSFPTCLLCTLPRESRVVITLYGNKIVSSDPKSPEAGLTQKVSLGWASVQLFDYNGCLKQGNFLCGLWPEEENKEYGPSISNNSSHCPIIQINLPDYGCDMVFPSVVRDYPCQRRDFEMLDIACQQELLNIIERSSLFLCTIEEKEFLWERRHYLYEIPQALPRVLIAAHSWDWACLADIYSMLKEWKTLSPIDALELLLPCFPDVEVRKTAINWVKNLGSDELCDYLPQLVQALKYEVWHDSPTAKFLLERSLTSIRVAHHLFWLLRQNLDDQRCSQRIRLVLNAMLAIAGRSMRARFVSQEELMKNLANVAEKIKTVKDSLRLNNLFQELEGIQYMLSESFTSLPLNPSLEVTGLEVKTCSYFTSNTLPLKLNFKTGDAGTKPIEAIFKVGDDLRQDMLTLQMIRIMDKLWLKEGLDLRVVTFGCIATGYKEGIVEMVSKSETLRKIQTEHGLTGSFKDRPIAEWLQKYNPSELEYQQAVENFTYSCAGYSVATYVLGICDRHNDNIMLKSTGHLFHIDFGKFLGDSQMFGNIKRDRVPFVLTSDMAYVINGGDKPSSKFQHFVELCCQAFNIVRKHGSMFLNLFALMAAAGIPGVNSEAVQFIQKALLPDVLDAEAAAVFARMIEDSLKSWFTQFNFFIHNLAQLRFTGDHNDGTLLSFIPKTYTLEVDGRIKNVDVIGYQKRYEPGKHYVYVLKVVRENQPDPVILFRSYREFCELQQKLCTLFPLAKYRYHSLPKSTMALGRSNIRQVAEKRKAEIDSFIQSLWKMADEVRHCDLCYTFFHPLLRDQQEGIAHLQKVKEPVNRRPRCEGMIHGQVKLSIRFHGNSLFIMVMHAKDLASCKNADPDPYVKTYLLPDPNKVTKRKTKVIRKSRHPTFMEMLQYRFPLDLIRQKSLQVSVWDHDRMAENTFLGAVSIPLCDIDLSKETTSWHSLGNLYR